MEPSAMPPWFIDSPDPETTHALAALLGRSIGARGLAIGLIGPLGSGKTAFVKGLAEGLGIDARSVSSPTFVIAQQYSLPQGPARLHHLDFYRLASESELESIGFLDLLGPGEVLAVEWLDRFPDALGPDRLEVVFVPPEDPDPARATAEIASASPDSACGGARRRIRVTAWGDEAARVLRDWSDRWAQLSREQVGARGSGSKMSAADSKLVLALLCAGWLARDAIGFETLASGTGDAAALRSPGCVALAPEVVDASSDPGRGDELGALRVRCVDPGREGSAIDARRLEGMARLLDGGTIDPNEASRRLLESLPGIGPGRAAAIEFERARAPLRSLRELERVSGIGPKTRARLEPFLAVDSGGPPG